jgi:hypothetical protein
MLEKWTTLDLRSLALYRISISVVILFDLFFYRLPNLTAFYTNEGFLPRFAFEGSLYVPVHFSLFFINDSFLFSLFLFLLLICSCVGLLLGWKTRWMTFFVWILLTSMHNRNPLTLQGGDFLIRLSLFWGMFLPLGKAWSIDSALSPPLKDFRTQGIMNIAFGLQILYMYWFGLFAKSGPEWTQDFTAVYYALQLDNFVRPFGVWLREQPLVYLKPLAIITLLGEFFLPLMLFIPWFKGWIRILAVFGLIAMHTSFEMFLAVGIFPYACFAVVLVFLPSSFWDLFSNSYPFDDWIRYQSQRLHLRFPFLTKTPSSVSPFLKKIGLSFGISCFLLVSWYNLFKSEIYHIPLKLGQFCEVFRLDQYWGMFAPSPSREDGWMVMVGKLKDGRTFNLYDHFYNFSFPEKFETEEILLNPPKPENAKNTFMDDRWRKYFMNIWAKDFQNYRAFLGRYIALQWNTRYSGNDQLAEFWIYYRLERTPDLGKTEPTVNMMLWHHWCFDK